MKCETARSHWHQSTDGGSDLSTDLREHLCECGVCRDYVADMERIAAGFDRLRQQTSGVSARQARPAARRGSALRIWIRVAAMVALIVGVYAILRQDGASRLPLVRDDRRIEITPLAPAEPEVIGITLHAESAKTMLAVAADGGEPEVQMYWLYPSLRSQTAVDEAATQ